MNTSEQNIKHAATGQVVLDDDDVDDDDDERQLKSQLWLQEPLFSVGKS